MSATKYVRLRHWWSKGQYRAFHAPYRNQLHDIDTDEPVSLREVFTELVKAECIKDGEIITIRVKRTGRRDVRSHWKLIESHTYKSVIGPSPEVSVPTQSDIKYDESFGDERLCSCEHTYHRHFDTYDNMAPIGCKYCPCSKWVEEG